MKKQKGITLIALIITIIVLVTLAVVAIIEISYDGVITKAISAVVKHNQKADEEKVEISWLEKLLGKNPENEGGSTDSGNTIEPDDGEDEWWCGHWDGEYYLCGEYYYYDSNGHYEYSKCMMCQAYAGPEEFGYHYYDKDGKCVCGDEGEPNTNTRPNPS